MKEDYSDNKLKDILKGKFADEYMAPPKSAWSNIQGQMATPARIRKPLYYWLIPTVLVVLIGGGIALNSVFSTNNKQTNTLANTEKENTSDSRIEKNEISKQDGITTSETQNNEAIEDTLPIENEDFSKSKKDPLVIEKLNINSKQTTAFQSNRKPIVNQNTKKSTFSKRSELENVLLEEKVLNSTKIETSNSTNEKNNRSESKEVSKLITKIDKVESDKDSNVVSQSTDSKVEIENIENDKQIVKTSEQITKDKEEQVSDVKKESAENKPKTIQVKDPDLLSKSEPKKEEVIKDKSKSENLNNDKENSSKDEVITDSDTIAKSDKALPENNVLLNSKKPRGKLRHDFYLGFGSNPRVSTFSLAYSENTTIVLAEKKETMKNRLIGYNMRYQFTPHFSMRSGVAIGGDRSSSNSFSIAMANSQLGEIIRIATSDGEFQSSGLVNQNLTSNGLDTSNYIMSVSHSQGYLLIPMSFVVNTKIQPGKLYYYGYSGLDFMAKGPGKNVLIINDGESDRNVNLTRISNGRKITTGLNIGFGMAYPFKSRLDLFTEINYSRDISNGLKTSLVNTKSTYVQLLIGIRF